MIGWHENVDQLNARFVIHCYAWNNKLPELREHEEKQDLPSPGSQPSLILLGFSLVLEFYFLLNFAACFILLPAKFASCLILLIA